MPYVRAADEIARSEIWHLDTSKDRLELLEEMVVGQVVFGQLLTILRRLGEEHYSAERFGARHGPGGRADLTGAVSRPATDALLLPSRVRRSVRTGRYRGCLTAQYARNAEIYGCGAMLRGGSCPGRSRPC